jgi:hypothetical protein
MYEPLTLAKMHLSTISGKLNACSTEHEGTTFTITIMDSGRFVGDHLSKIKELEEKLQPR